MIYLGNTAFCSCHKSPYDLCPTKVSSNKDRQIAEQSKRIAELREALNSANAYKEVKHIPKPKPDNELELKIAKFKLNEALRENKHAGITLRVSAAFFLLAITLTILGFTLWGTIPLATIACLFGFVGGAMGQSPVAISELRTNVIRLEHAVEKEILEWKPQTPNT